MSRITLLLLLISLLGALVASQPISYAVDGCPCMGRCSRTVDNPYYAWCITSPEPIDNTPNNTLLYCGQYDDSRRAYTDACIVNTTGAATANTISDFNGLWTTMTISTTLACAAAYGIAGCIASALISAKKTMWWLPAAAVGLGACQGFCIGAVFAVIASFLFLSIPYAMEWSTVVALGIGLAVLIVYGALGRHYDKIVVPHVSEYAD